MSAIVSKIGDSVEPEKRRAMTPARKNRIWLAWDKKCWFCRQPIEESGPTVVYDHVNPLWIKGSDADSEFGPIHAKPCNKIKTAADLKNIAKVKRLIAKEDGTRRPRKAIQSRGFDKTKSRGFDGKVRSR